MSGHASGCRSALVSAALVLATVFVSAGQQTAAPSQPQSVVRTGLIVGRVVDAKGAPIPEAMVRLMPSGSSEVPPNGRVLADGEGRFFFADLPPGRYFVQASREGFTGGGIGQGRPGGSPTGLTLGPGERRADLTLVMWKFAAIAGTVVDEFGEPVVGIGVRALPRTVVGGRPSFGNVDTPGDPPAAVTDDRGQFRLPRLLPGEYVVFVPSTLTTMPVATVDASAQDPRFGNSLFWYGIQDLAARGQARALQMNDAALLNMTRVMPPRQTPDGRLLVYPATYFPSARSPFDGTLIVVGTGDERAGITVTMRPVPAVRISGRLVKPDGSAPPPLGIKVSGSAADGVSDSDLSSGTGLPLALFDTAVAMSDQQGRFTMLGVPTGDYVIRHARRILYPAVAEGTGYWIAQPLRVGATDIDDLVVTLKPAVRIEGRVEVARGLDIAALPASLTRGFVNFQTSHGEPGRFAAEVREPNGPRTFGSAGGSGGRIVIEAAESQGWVVESMTIDGKDVTDRAFDLESDVTSLVVTYTNRVSRVSGTVKDARGAAHPSAMVVAFPVDETRWRDYGSDPRTVRSTYADDDGGWAFSHLPPGEYFVRALEDEDPHLWRDPDRLKLLASQATRITVAPGAPRSVDLIATKVRR